ncbi:MAG: hypothetical protein IJ151_03380 [Bacteroidales bacterium]|nr:hypothetical protein [Bacteroidales bacterium]
MRKLLIILTFVLFPLAVMAQDTDLFGQYKASSASGLPLYRGKTATKYSFSYNGVYTWDRGGFRTGDLVFAGKLYKALQMNINAHLQTLLVYDPENYTTVDLGNTEVEEFSLGTEVFKNLSAKGYKLPKGFYKVIYEGEESVYERIDKEFIRDVHSSNDGTIGYKDPDYKEGVFEFFAQHRCFYYIGKEGKPEKFTNPKLLLGKHKDKKKAIRKMLKENRLNDADYAVQCLEIMKFIENAQ